MQGVHSYYNRCSTSLGLHPVSRRPTIVQHGPLIQCDRLDLQRATVNVDKWYLSMVIMGQASNGLNSGTAGIYFHDLSKFLFQCWRHRFLQHSVSSMALIAWSSGWGSSTPLTKTWVRTLSFETMTTGGSATAAPEGSETS